MQSERSWSSTRPVFRPPPPAVSDSQQYIPVMYSSSRSTTPDSAAMMGSSLRHVQFSRQQLVRRPSYADLGDQDEDYWDEQDEQREDEPFYYDDRDGRQGQTRDRGPTPPAEKDHMNRFTTRGAPQPKPQHFVPVERQHSGSRPAPVTRGSGGSVKAAVSKFQYRAADANASSSSLMLPKTHFTGGSAPIPILRQNTGQYPYRGAGAGSVPTRMALSAPTGGSAMAMGMNPAMNDSPNSLLRTNPNLKVVDGELRMSVFPERKRSVDAASGTQLVHAHQRRGSSPDSTEADITEMAARDRMRIEELERERDSLRAELARRPQSPEPAPAAAETRAGMVPRPSVPSMAPPSVTKAVSSTFRPAPEQSFSENTSESKALVSPKALVARNFVASIVSELKSSAQRKGRPGPPAPPPSTTKPTAAPGGKGPSKWAPVDTSAGLKRKWEPGSHVPSTLRSYIHLLSGGPTPHALGRMGSAN